MLIKMRSIEITESSLIFRKMRGHPVQDHADSALMKIINEVHEIRWCAEPAGGSKVADCLISPGTVERMLHNRKKFDVCETCVMDVVSQQRCQLAVCEP